MSQDATGSDVVRLRVTDPEGTEGVGAYFRSGNLVIEYEDGRLVTRTGDGLEDLQMDSEYRLELVDHDIEGYGDIAEADGFQTKIP